MNIQISVSYIGRFQFTLARSYWVLGYLIWY